MSLSVIKYSATPAFRFWNSNNLSFDREEAYETPYDANEYERYRNRDLPDENTANRNDYNPDEYDRYQYDRAESTVDVGDTPKDKPCESMKSCCNNIGWLIDAILSAFYNKAQKGHFKRGIN